jgi:hypothetical protein
VPSTQLTSSSACVAAGTARLNFAGVSAALRGDVIAKTNVNPVAGPLTITGLLFTLSHLFAFGRVAIRPDASMTAHRLSHPIRSSFRFLSVESFTGARGAPRTGGVLFAVCGESAIKASSGPSIYKPKRGAVRTNLCPAVATHSAGQRSKCAGAGVTLRNIGGPLPLSGFTVACTASFRLD